MNGCDRWLGWMNGWKDGRRDRWIDRGMDGMHMVGITNANGNGWDEWMDGMDGRTA